MPAASVTGEQGVGGERAPCPGHIVGEVGGSRVFPEIEHRLHDPPGILDEVGAREERRVAVEGAVEQHLIPRAPRRLESLGVVEPHAGPLQLERRTGPLRLHANLDALKGLDVEDQQVGLATVAGLRLELHDDLGAPFPESFSRPQVDGHPGPAVVVEMQFERGVGGVVRLRIDVRFLPVAKRGRSVGLRARAVLPTNAVPRCGSRIEQSHCAEQSRLLVAHGRGLERRGQFHAHVGQHLHEVILEHVADHTRLVVILATGLHTHGFGGRDLDVVDMRGVPERREHPVGHAEGQQILHRFLAQIMIDAIDLVFAPVGQQGAVERHGRIQILAEWLFDNDFPAARKLREPGLIEQTVHRLEKLGRDGQIEERVARGAGVAADRQHRVTQPRIGLGVAKLARRVMEPRLQPGPAVGVEIAAGVKPLDVLSLLLAKRGCVERATGHPDDSKLRRQQAVAGEVVECRHEEPLGEVARCPQDHEHPRGSRRLAAAGRVAQGPSLCGLCRI